MFSMKRRSSKKVSWPANRKLKQPLVSDLGFRISVAVVEVGLTNRVLCSFRCFGFDLLPGEDGGKKSQ